MADRRGPFEALDSATCAAAVGCLIAGTALDGGGLVASVGLMMRSAASPLLTSAVAASRFKCADAVYGRRAPAQLWGRVDVAFLPGLALLRGRRRRPEPGAGVVR